MKSVDLAQIIDEESTAGGVSPALMRNLILTGENYGRTDIPTNEVSQKSARGVAQVTDATWKGLQAQGKIPLDANQTDPRMNVRAAVQVAKDGLAYGNGDERVATAWYNGGKPQASAVLAGKEPPAAETQNYLKRTGMTTSSTSRETYKVADVPTGALADTTDNIQTANAAVLAQLQIAMTGSAQAQLQEANATEAAAHAQGVSILARGNLDPANKQDRIDTAALFHSTTAELQALENKRADADNAMQMLRPRIEEDNAVQPWDDPLRWIVNKFTLPGQVQTYNNLNSIKNDVTKTIATKNQEMLARNSLDIAPTVDLMRQAAVATAGAAVQTGLAQGAAIRAQSATTVAQSLLQTMTANNTTLEQRMRLQQQFMTTLQLGAQDKEEKDLEPLVGAVNLKLASAGATTLYSVAEFKRLPSKTQGELLQYSRMQGYGDGPGDSLRFLSGQNLTQGLSVKDPTTYKQLSTLVNSDEYKRLLAEQMKGPGGPAFVKLSDLEQKSAVLDILAGQQSKEAMDRTKGGTGNNLLPDSNPYKLRITDMAQVPGLQDNTFVKDIVERVSADPRVVVSHDDVLRTFLAKAKADPTKLAQYSKELSDFFIQGSKWQWDKGGSRMLGYPMPRDYVVSSIQTDATGRALQLGNVAEIENYAIRNIAKEARDAKMTAIQGSTDGTAVAPFSIGF